MQRTVLTWLFLVPTLIGPGLFIPLSILTSIALAFFRRDIITDPQFVGLDNFVQTAADPTTRVFFLSTIAFVITTITLQLAFVLGLVVLVNMKMPALLRPLFRSVLFFPLILLAASVLITMSYLFNENFGLVNHFLNMLRIGNVAWLTLPQDAMVVVVLVCVWQNFGFSFLLFLGGLASILKGVYEAAQVDGATSWRQFWRITFPLVSPATLTASVMAIISALQILDQPYVLTRGGPGGSTRTTVMVICESAFKQLELRKASAISIVLTILIMLVTALQFRLSRRFMFYG